MMKFTMISFLICSLLVVPSFSVSNGGPQLTSEMRVIHENGQVSIQLTCYFDEPQDATLTWSRQFKKRLPSQRRILNGWLEISNIQPDDGGMYYCKTFAQHHHSIPRKTYLAPIRVDATALRPVAHNVDRQLTTIVTVRKGPRGTDIFLDCYGTEDRNLIVQWQRHNNLPMPPQQRTPDNGRLAIFNIQPNQAGWYYCRTNQHDHSARGHQAPILLDFEKLGLGARRAPHKNNRFHSQQNPRVISTTRRPNPSTTPLAVTERAIESRGNQPEITVYPCQRDGTVEVLLDCRIATDKNVTFHWGRRYKSLPKQAQNYTSATYSEMNIFDMQQNDEGIYYCETVECEPSREVHRKRTEVRLAFKALRVEAKKVPCIRNHFPSEQNPRVTENERGEINLKISYVFNENRGANVILDCRDINSKHVEVEWRRQDNKPLSKRVRSFSYENAEYSKMDIYDMQPSDEGVYYCETVGSDPSAKGHRAEIRLSLTELRRGPCDVSSKTCKKHEDHSEKKPRVIETTRKPNPTTTPHPVTTTKPSVNPQHLDNSIINTETKLNERNNVGLRVLPQSQVVEEDDIVVVNCHRSPGIAKNFRWLREDNQAFSPTAVRKNGHLTIYGVQSEDAGVYFCEYIDEDSSQIERVKYTLKVKKFGTIDEEEPCNMEEPERLLLNSEYPGPGGNFETAIKRDYKLKIYPEFPVMNEHSNITLSCYDEDHLPVPVYWRLRDGGSISSRVIISNGLITFSNAQLEDAGFYVCQVVGTSSPKRGERADVTLAVNRLKKSITRANHSQ